MGEAALKRTAYEQILDAPDTVIAEIIAGEPMFSPRPSSPHAWTAQIASADTVDAFGRRRGGQGPGGWWILPEPEIHLGAVDPTDDVLVPDLAGWKLERMPVLLDVAAFTLAPDWVCEIISPSTARVDRVHKPTIYARAGVLHLWLADPAARTLEVYELRSGLYVRLQAFAGDVRVRAAPFDAVELDIGGWWLPG